MIRSLLMKSCVRIFSIFELQQTILLDLIQAGHADILQD